MVKLESGGYANTIMKTPIRIKFFVVLLCFSLGPLLVSRGILGGMANRAMDEISEDTRQELLGIVSNELQYNAQSMLSILDRGGHAMGLGVLMLAQRAEHFLDWEKHKEGRSPLYASDFGRTSQSEANATFVRNYSRLTMSGRQQPMKVSLDFPTVRKARHRNELTADDDLRRLQYLLPTFKEVYAQLKGSSYWLNVGLDSGAFITYPGHGGYPMMYDHRMQPWYTSVKKQKDGVVWSAPDIDPATKRAVISVSYPVRDKNRQPVGVASIDIPMSELLSVGDVESRWQGEVKTFLVKRKPGDELLILAQQSYDQEGRRHWMTGIELENLTSSDAEGFSEFLTAMHETHGGVMRLPYKGEDSVWAFANSPTVSFILIAPERVVSALPDKMASRVGNLFDRMRSISAFISGIMLIVTGLIAWFGSRAVSRPLLQMADAAKRLADGDFDACIQFRTGDERDLLIDSFNDMGPKLKERLHLRRDMELASEVQNLLLPKSTPDLSGFDLAGGIAYCDQTGGDYYDFIEFDADDSHGLAVVVGDVSGHGAASSLIMAEARGQLHALSGQPMTPKERIRTVNRFLSRDMDGTGRFLTLFYLRLIKDSGLVRWVRAGHDPAMRYNPATGEFGELGGDGLALGVLGDFEYEDYEAELASGEVVVICTDGVWEARNAEGVMFGKERILDLIRENAHTCCEEIRRAIMRSVDAYQGDGQVDDIAVVVIKKD